MGGGKREEGGGRREKGGGRRREEGGGWEKGGGWEEGGENGKRGVAFSGPPTLQFVVILNKYSREDLRYLIMRMTSMIS